MSIQATLSDGLIYNPHAEVRGYTVEIFCARAITMDANTAYTVKRIELNNEPISFELPKFVPFPPDANLDMYYILVDNQNSSI